MASLAFAHNAPYGSDASRLYYGTDTHSMGLLLGAACGALAAGREVIPRDGPRRRLMWLTDGLAAGALVTLVIVVCSVRESSPVLYRGGFLGVAALTAVVAAAAARGGSRLGRVLDRRPLRWLAARSYSIYLWHWPVAVVTRPGVDVHWTAPMVLLVRVGATMVLADATYRMVELPIRTVGLRDSLRGGVRRLSRVVLGQAPVGARLATAGLVATVLVAGGVLASGPKPTLSAGQKALAAEHGGRHLQLGPLGPSGRAPLPVGDISTPTAQATTPAPSSSAAGPKHPHPHATRPSHDPPVRTISAFGDSVMLGARSSLDRRFPGGTLDAIEGRQPDPILQDIEQDAAADKLNPIVVIGVGDNGLIDPDSLWHTLGRLRDIERVIVVNNRVGRYWEHANNQTIARVVPHFGNATILDWHSVSGPHPSWFYDDGIHLTPDGAVAYARLIAAAARRR
jgi:hypothetical protein